jgi:hypothetical protein
MYDQDATQDKIQGVAELKQENASKLTSHSHHSTPLDPSGSPARAKF